MAALQAELTVRIDVGDLAQGLLAEVGGPLGELRAVAVPLDADGLEAAAGGAGEPDFSVFAGTLGQVSAAAGSVLERLPGAEVLAPLTSALETVELATRADLAGGLGRLLADLAAQVEGDRQGGLLGVLHAVATALGDAQEGRILLDLLSRLPGNPGISLSGGLPGADVVRAADGAVRALGGLMVLETVLAEAERLTGVMAAQADPAVLRADLAALDAALAPGGVALAAVLRAAAADPAALRSAVDLALAAAARLDALDARLSGAMGLGEATLVYLDVDRVLAEVDGAMTLLRTADVDPLGRQTAAVQGWLGPLLAGIRLENVPARRLDALLDEVEGRIAEAAGGIAALPVEELTAPLAEGIAFVSGLLGTVRDVIERITREFRAAMTAVRDALAALPFADAALALREALAPLADGIDAVRAVVEQVRVALDAAAREMHRALEGIEGGVDRFAAEVDALFAGARAYVEQIDLAATLGAVGEQVRSFTVALDAAAMAPYFDAAQDAIGVAADVVGAVPWDLVPESMKAEVDAAVLPVKEADAGAVAGEIEALLQITPDGRFALRADLEAAIADVQAQFEALVESVAELDPRAALSQVDAMLREVAARIAEISPALTLQPLRDALDRVKEAIAAADPDALLEPVRDVFRRIDEGLESVSPGTLLAPVQARLDEAREQLKGAIRLESWAPALDELAARAEGVLSLVDPARLEPLLASALGELETALGALPAIHTAGAFGTVVSLLLEGMGLRVRSDSFVPVAAWLGGASASAHLNGRALRISASVARTRDAVAALDVAALAAGAVQRAAAAVAAAGELAVSLPSDSPEGLRLASASARLDAGAVVGRLAANRARYLAALEHSAAEAETLRRTGFTQADTSVAALREGAAPLAPSLAWLRTLLGKLGLSPEELSVAGVVGSVLAAAPPARLAALFLPLFTALRDRVRTLLSGVIDPLKAGIAEVGALIDAVDLGPLLEAMDAVVDEVKAQVAAFNPDVLLGEPLASFRALRAALLDADPLAAVAAIVADLQAALVRVLGKLELETLLASPLAIYDHLLAQLRALDVTGLLTPVFVKLDEIALQVDVGLEGTVAAFEELQAALPGGGGGGSVSASLSVSVG